MLTQLRSKGQSTVATCPGAHQRTTVFSQLAIFYMAKTVCTQIFLRF